MEKYIFILAAIMAALAIYKTLFKTHTQTTQAKEEKITSGIHANSGMLINLFKGLGFDTIDYMGYKRNKQTNNVEYIYKSVGKAIDKQRILDLKEQILHYLGLAENTTMFIEVENLKMRIWFNQLPTFEFSRTLFKKGQDVFRSY